MTLIDTSLATTAPATKPVRQRLIDAAEQLFAEHGWNGVSIRTIAAAADVSLAALNYHFGLKENLLAEIFAARARPIAEERMRLLAEVEANANASLEDVIEAFLRPALTKGAENRMFARLRARLATEPEAFSRRILSDSFDDSSRMCMAALQKHLPDLPSEALYWRFHFLLGTMVYTMADSGRIQSLSDGACDPGDVGAALRHIVPFLAAGFRAASPAASPRSRRTKK
jgi:AcrR family transcriptional regulator